MSVAFKRAGGSAQRCKQTPGPGVAPMSCETRMTVSSGQESSSTGRADAQVRPLRQIWLYSELGGEGPGPWLESSPF